VRSAWRQWQRQLQKPLLHNNNTVTCSRHCSSRHSNSKWSHTHSHSSESSSSSSEFSWTVRRSCLFTFYRGTKAYKVLLEYCQFVIITGYDYCYTHCQFVIIMGYDYCYTHCQFVIITGYDYCYALPPAECSHFEFVSSSCFCCEAPFTNKEHTCKQSHRVHYSIGTMDTASTNGVPIMCPILRLPPTFEPKSSTRRHFSSLCWLVWNFWLSSDFENFDFQSIPVLLSKQPKNAVLMSRVPLGCRVSSPDGGTSESTTSTTAAAVVVVADY